jgi:hypothetical protein
MAMQVFNNHLILKGIVKYLPIPDLNSLRMVNRDLYNMVPYKINTKDFKLKWKRRSKRVWREMYRIKYRIRKNHPILEQLMMPNPNFNWSIWINLGNHDKEEIIIHLLNGLLKAKGVVKVIVHRHYDCEDGFGHMSLDPLFFRDTNLNEHYQKEFEKKGISFTHARGCGGYRMEAMRIDAEPLY